MMLGEVYFDVAVNPQSVDSAINLIKGKLNNLDNLNLTPTVNDNALTKLNKHLDLKKKHFIETQKYFNNNPLKITVDDSSLKKISKEIEAKVKLNIELGDITNSNSQTSSDTNSKLEPHLIQISTDIKSILTELVTLNKSTIVNGTFKPFQSIGVGLFESVGKNFTDSITKGFADSVKQVFKTSVSEVVTRATNKATTPYKRDLNKDIFGDDISPGTATNNRKTRVKRPSNTTTSTPQQEVKFQSKVYEEVKVPAVIDNEKENIKQVKLGIKVVQGLVNKNFSSVINNSLDILSVELSKKKPDISVARAEFDKIKTGFSNAYKNLQQALQDNNTKLAKAYAQSILSTAEKAKADINKITESLVKSGVDSKFGSEIKTLSGSTKGIITSRYVNPTKRQLTSIENKEEFNKTTSIGKDVLAGLTTGLKDKSGVIREGSDISLTLLNAIRKSLGISSPSKKAIEIMSFVKDGFLIGIGQTKKAVGSAAKGLGDAILPKVKSTFPNLLPKTFEERKQDVIDRRNAVVDPLGLNYIKRSIRQGIAGQPIESLYKDGKFTPSTKLADNAGSVKFFENLYERITRQAILVSNKEFGKPEGSTIARQAGTMLATSFPAPALAGLASPLAVPLLPTYQAFNLAKKLITPIVEQLNKAIETVVPLQLSLSNLKGSETEGRETLSYLQKFSDKTGTNLQSSSKGFVDLSFATKGTKLEGEETKDLYEGIASASKYVGASSAETSLIFQSFTQMVSKGKISMEELRQQLSEKFPPAMQVFAKALGVSVPELTALVSKGALLAEDVLPKVAQVLKKDFSKGAESAANSYVTSANRMENATFNFYTKLVDSFGGLKTVFLNLGSGIFETFNTNFQNIVKIFNVGLITLIASTAAGFSAIISAPSLAPKVAIVSNFFTATFRKGISLATPFIAGMLIDLVDDVFGAKHSVYENIASGITNAFVGAFTVIDDLARNLSGTSLFAVDLESTGKAKNLIEQIGESIGGVFRIIPPGVAEFSALIFAFQQIGLLASAYVLPTLNKLGGALKVFGSGIGNAIFNLGNIRDSLKDIFPSILHSAKNALGIISGFAVNAVGALAVLSLSQSDFANPLQKSFSEASLGIKNSIKEIKTSLNELADTTKKTGNTIKESLELKDKGLELNPLKILGISDESSGVKSDKVFRKLNKLFPGRTEQEEKYAEETQTQAKSLGLSDFISPSDRYLTEAQKQLLNNAKDIQNQGTQLNKVLSDLKLTPDKAESLITSKGFQNDIEAIKKIDESLKNLGEKRSNLALINTADSKKQIRTIDAELKVLETQRGQKIKPISGVISNIADIRDSLKSQKDAIEKADLPKSAKIALKNLLAPQEELINETEKIFSNAGLEKLVKPLETIWTTVVTKLQDANIEYEKFKDLSKISGNVNETKITSNLQQSEATKKLALNNASGNQLSVDKEKLTSIATLRRNSLKDLLSISNVEQSDARKKEIDELREQVKKDSVELSEIDLKIAQNRETIYKEAVTNTKTVADYYIGIANQAELLNIDNKKLINSNTTNTQQNKLREALTDGHDNIVTQYVDSIIESLGQNNSVSDKALDAQKQLIQLKQTDFDQRKAYNDVIRAIPEVSPVYTSVSKTPIAKINKPTQLVEEEINKPQILSKLNNNIKKEAVEIEKSFSKIDLLKQEFAKGNYLAFITIPLDDLKKYLKSTSFGKILKESFLGLGLIWNDFSKAGKESILGLGLIFKDFKKIINESFLGLGLIWNDFSKAGKESILGLGLIFNDFGTVLNQSFTGLGFIFADISRLTIDWLNRLIPVDEVSKVLNQSLIGLGLILTDLGRITVDWFNRLIPVEEINKVLNQSFIGIGLALQGISRDTYNWVNSVIPLDDILITINQSFMGLGLIMDDVLRKTQEWVGYIQQGISSLAQATQNLAHDASTSITTATNNFGDAVGSGVQSLINQGKLLLAGHAEDLHHGGKNYYVKQFEGKPEQFTKNSGLIAKDITFKDPKTGRVDTKVPSSASGIAEVKNDPKGYGQYVRVVDSTGKLLALAAHLSQVLVKTGDRISYGQTLGIQGGKPGQVGAGNSTGTHVHYEMQPEVYKKFYADIASGAFLSKQPQTSGVRASANMIDRRQTPQINQTSVSNTLGQIKRGGNDLTPAEIARLTPQGRQLYQYRNDPRVLAVADTVARAEGTDFRSNSKNFGYGMMIGGENTKDFSTHPFVGTGRKPRDNSTASGRYQLMNFNWKGSDSERLFTGKQAPSFTPGVQDLFLLGALKKRGVLDEVLKGDIQGAFSKPNVNSLAAEYASLEHNGRPSYYSGQGTPEGRKKQTIPFTQQRLQARLNQSSTSSPISNNVVQSSLQYRPSSNADLRKTANEARGIQQNANSVQANAIRQQTEQEIAKDKDEFIRKQNAALRTFKKAGLQEDDSFENRRRNLSDLSVQNLKNPSPKETQNQDITRITRQYNDLLKEYNRNIEDLKNRASDAEKALATGQIPEGGSTESLKERLSKDKTEIAALQQAIPQLEKLRSQAISESENLFKRDENLRLQNNNFEIRTQELNKYRSDLESLKLQSGLAPYENIGLQIPQIERELQLKEADLELEKAIADIEEKRYKNTFSADSATNNKIADTQIEKLKQQNISKQEGIELTFKQADASTKLEFATRILERENTLLEIRNDMRQEELKTLELIQKRNPLTRAGEQIGVQKLIDDESRRNELAKRKFDITNDTKLSPIQRLQDLSKVDELYRVRQSNADTQFELDNEQQNITNLQNLATRNSSQRDFLSKPLNDLTTVRAGQITSRGGNQYEANALLRPNARNQEILRYENEVDSFNTQSAELKFQGLITDEQISKMREALDAIHNINLKDVNEQFKTFGSTIDDIAKSSIKGLSSGLADVILKGGSLTDVFLDFADTLLSGVIQAGLDSLLSSLTGSLFGTGGSKSGSPLGGGLFDFVGSIFGGGGGLGGGLGSILGFASGGEVPFISGKSYRETDSMIGRALKREGANAVLSTLTPGERVLTVAENRLYNALHPDGIMNIPTRNFNKGGEVLPSMSESAVSRMSGSRGSNININASIESEGKSVDEKQSAKLIRAVVISEIQRQERMKRS